jgi:SAM-dependent methyltransferase
MNELIKIISPRIKDNSIVVDFGAGTGASALHLIKGIKANFRLWLVDNSAAWLAKAHEIFKHNPNVECFLLEKTKDRYATLAETVGEGLADHVISANTLHLIPDLEGTFKGINAALKAEGTFTFQSGNIISGSSKNGILLIDDTIKKVHEIALDIVRTKESFAGYRKDLARRIELEGSQRRFMFPEPRHLKEYLEMLKAAGFECEKPRYKLIRIAYKDWLDFLRVKRLQAGILPEIGGRNPTLKEEQDRDELITMASMELFKELESGNQFADKYSFVAEWVYVTAAKVN